MVRTALSPPSPFPQPGIPSPANAQFFAQSQYIFLPTKYHPSSTTQWTAQHPAPVQPRLAAPGRLHRQQDQPRPDRHPRQPRDLHPGRAERRRHRLPWPRPHRAGRQACRRRRNTLLHHRQRPPALLPHRQPTPLQGDQFSGGGGGSVFVGDFGTGNYHGLVTTVQHRLSSSFSLLANHTWSKCLNEEDAQGDLRQGPPSKTRQTLPWITPPAALTIATSKTSLLVAESRFAIANRFASYLVNGWEIAPLAHILSAARPFTVTTAGVDQLAHRNVGNDRPSLISGVPIYLNTQIQSGVGLTGTARQLARGSLNPLPPSAQRPTTPRAPLRSHPEPSATSAATPSAERPNYQFDAQISRIFPTRERLNATLRLEAFNVLNHAQL